jgi:hypothetical protein
VFLFGLLSTPLPYILIASIYLLGFASGIFSNQEVAENKVQEQQTIRHEQIVQPEENCILFCNEFNKQIKEIDFELLKHSFYNEYDTGQINFRIEQIEIQSFCYSCDRFSRPPPFCLS